MSSREAARRPNIHSNIAEGRCALWTAHVCFQIFLTAGPAALRNIRSRGAIGAKNIVLFIAAALHGMT